MIIVENIVKSFGTQRAVDGISFEIRSGECFGLLGPNGAGKSTTINMLVGLLSPDSGRVSVDGQSPDSPNTRRTMGVAPQSLAIYNELTARENLEFFGRLYGLGGSGLKDRVGWALKLAGLEDRAKHRASTFSGGMKRRLNIAAALVHQPKLLLLDEPTVGVDPQSRNHIFDWIEQLKTEGMTLLYTTHYMEEAQRLCDRVAIVDHGRLLALDTIPNLLKQHGGHSVVRGVLETVPDSAKLPGQRTDDQWRLDSENPFNELADLVASGVKFQSVEIKAPDLETVFLSLTGRELRD